MKQYNKTVIFDIDGVINNIQSTIDACNRVTGKNIKREDVKNYNLTKVFNITQDEMSHIFQTEMERIIMDEVVSENIFELFDFFRNDYCGGNNKILIMTARDEPFEKYTMAKFKESGIVKGIHYDEIYHGCIPKEEYLIKQNPDAVIEDRAKTLISLKEDLDHSCDMFLMDRPYNKEYNQEYITRITENTKKEDLQDKKAL